MSTRATIFALLATGWTSVFAQSATPSPTVTPTATPALLSPQTVTELARIRDAALGSDYAWREVAHLTNNIGPRLSGSAQAQKAVEYVAGEMKSLGCEVQLEKVMTPHWVRGEETAALVQFPGQAAGTTQKIVVTALGGSVATPPDALTADVVVARNFDELDSLGRARVEGKIVLFDHAFDKQMAEAGHGGEAYGEAVVYRSRGPVEAAKLGAVAALIRSVGGADFRLPHTGQTNYAADAPKIPAGAVTTEDAALITALCSEGTVRMRLLLTPQQLPDVESANVIADIKGSAQPEQVVIVSGHLDSWDLGTGAIDDGAGVAVSIEVAHLIQQLKLRPKRTIRIIAWMNEENGLRGGTTYAVDHANDIGKHVAAIETDEGAAHPLGLRIHGKAEIKEWLAPVAKVLEQSGAGILALNEGSGGADIGPLDARGLPTFAPLQDSRTYFFYHHTAADTLDKIVPRELAENAAVVAVAAYALANLERPLPR
jgi:Zn-dependent M28 family amino/carboxypeptidase